MDVNRFLPIKKEGSSALSRPLTLWQARGTISSKCSRTANKAIADRMDALQISRKFDFRKITPRTIHLTHREEAEDRPPN
jgi:hypothetical protein